ncbi:cation:proton antiporter [Massilia sp. erpn]|uniref:cation:proton antiporter n=1 Tax=Massilia sp. erpn TaxID=2738142 RepID=UPI002107709B|nr:cation:proton antiporter [Massilia sp. erpn]UTY57084.1 cation:proton antiporter [Massilia sp. erpn]
MTTSEVFLIAIILVFGAPYILWRLCNMDYYAPLVVVQMIVGISLGPAMLGSAYPSYYALIFSSPVVQALSGLAWWGVMIFVMLAGIELDLGETWKHRRESAITASLALGSPLLLGGVAAFILQSYGNWAGALAEQWQFILSVGMACSVTSLPILILLLEKLDIMRAPLGQRVLRYASLDDVVIWAVLAVILLDWQRVGQQAAMLAGFALVAPLYRALMVRLNEQDRWYVALLWLAICGFASDRAGLHYMVGAFLAGLVTEASWFEQRKLDMARSHVLMILMPAYFLITGLRTNWSVGSSSILVATALLLVAAIGGKLAGLRIAGKILNWSNDESDILGWLLQTKGLIMIVFANILLDKQLISNDMFAALMLMAIVSTMLTVPVIYPKLQGRQLPSKGAELT